MELLVPKRQGVSIELSDERVVSTSVVKYVCVKEHRAIRAFGEAELMAWLDPSLSYRLELPQLSGLGQSISRLPLWGMSDFRLVTVQGGIRTIHSGCEWQELTGQVDVGNGLLAEHTVMTARERSRGEELI